MRGLTYKVATSLHSCDHDRVDKNKDEDRMTTTDAHNPEQRSAMKHGAVGVSRAGRPHRSSQAPSRIFRRLVGYCAALLFIQISSSACIDIWNLLMGKQQQFRRVLFYISMLLPYMGTVSVRESSLVLEVLNNITTPRDSTIYLHNEFETSAVDCGVPLAVPGTYTNDFQRQLFWRIVLDTEYNLTFTSS